MDTKQLRTFVVLAKEKNYIKASEILNYAPSTLAKHIHVLEAEFSTTFVHFQNGAICLTKDGEIFLPYAKEMLKMYDKCEATFKQKHRDNKIIVAGGELMVAFSFGSFMHQYQKEIEFSSIEVNTICCSRVPEWLEKQECDIGYVQMVDLSECGSAKVTPLFQEKLCVMTSPFHPLANKDKVYLKDFENQSFTFTYSECCFTEHFRNLLQDADIALKSELFLGSVTAVVESCMKEKRLCLVPYVAVDKLKEYGLVAINWIDAFPIYDCIMTSKTVQPQDELYPIVEASRNYCLQLKKDAKTRDIVLL